MALTDYSQPGMQSEATDPQNPGVQPGTDSYPGTPEGTLQCINDIRAKLDALEQAIQGEETAEGQTDTTQDTGAEVPMPGAAPATAGAGTPEAPPTDEEIVAGLKKPTPMSVGFGGQGRGR